MVGGTTPSGCSPSGMMRRGNGTAELRSGGGEIVKVDWPGKVVATVNQEPRYTVVSPWIVQTTLAVWSGSKRILSTVPISTPASCTEEPSSNPATLRKCTAI